MATSNVEDLYHDSDTDSIDSIDTDDGEYHLPEKIIAEVTRTTTYSSAQTWYLIKWEDCSLLRSSWEGIGFAENFSVEM